MRKIEKPDELYQAARNADTIVNQVPGHELFLGSRQEVYNAIAIENSEAERKGNAGFYRQVMLSIIAVEGVTDLWKQAVPGGDLPVKALNKTKAILAGELDPKIGIIQAHAYWKSFKNLRMNNPELAPVAPVGYAASRALKQAAEQKTWRFEPLNYHARDHQLPEEDRDASHFASVAAAGGAAWGTASDAEKRKEYWNWWINHAIPLAWDSWAEREKR